MNQMVYGYARVSSATQNEDRQMLAMAQMQVPEEIYTWTSRAEKILNGRSTRSFFEN